MTTTFRPSTLPDLPADLRAVSKALAVRLAAIGYNDDARALKGVTKCWTAIRAAKAAGAALYTFDSAKVATFDALEADLAVFVERAQAAIDARTGRTSARVSL